MLTGHPGRRGPQVGSQFQAEVAILVILAGSDLFACGGQLAGLAVLEHRGHADNVLGFDVVAVLRISRDHAHQLLGRGGHHIDLDAVFHQFVVQLGLAGEDFRRLYLGFFHHVAFEIADRHGLAGGHQLVDLHFEFLEGKAGKNLRNPRVADHVVDFAQAIVVAEQTFLMVGGVFEGDKLERRVHGFAGDQALVFHERQQRLFKVIAVAGVVHVEHRVVTLVGIGGDHFVELFGGRCRPVFQLGGGKRLAGKPEAKGGGYQ